LTQIRESLNRISDEFKKPNRRLGKTISEKAQLILLWTYLLKKKKNRALEKPFIDRKRHVSITHRIIETIDWNDYYRLLKWFSIKLKNTSYHFYIVPLDNQGLQKKYAKSILQKNYSNMRLKVESKIRAFNSVQEYFSDWSPSSKKRSIKIGKVQSPRGERPLFGHPIFNIEFGDDFIQLGEIVEEGYLFRKTKFNGSQKIQEKLDLQFENTQESSDETPTLKFQGMNEYICKEYSLSLPSFEEIAGEILNK
jgi:hypothetical protein